MAAAVAGVKRSYHDMTSAAAELRDSEFASTSRVQSPLETPTSTSNTPSDLVSGEKLDSQPNVPRQATFAPSASVVLIGVRGVGKSTLGVLAATAYNRRLIDTERAFLEATGSTTAAYRKQNGTAEYQRRHKQVLQDTLKTNNVGAIIVCNFSDLEGEGRRTIKDYSQSHPVIHVTRDAEGIQSYLRVWTRERIDELLSASSSLLRRCSNYEFFNLSENGNNGFQKSDVLDHSVSRPPHAAPSHGSFLTLKRVERDFIRLLRNIIGDYERQPVHHSAYPFSHIEVERRTHTFAVTISVTEVISKIIDLDDMQIGADCVELVVDSNINAQRNAFSELSMAFAILRRATVLPILLTVRNNVPSSQLHQIAVLEMTDMCLRLGPELCTADLSLENSQLSQLIRCKGSSRVLGALEIHDHPSEGWDDRRHIETYIRAANLGCDIVKLTIPAQSINDAFRMSFFQHAIDNLGMKPRLIAYNSGPKGNTSKCFNKVLTSVEPPRLSETGRNAVEEVAVTAKAITEALFASFMFEPMKFSLCGADVSYSLSPAMHNAAYQACGMRYTYQGVSTDNLDAIKSLMRSVDTGGIAVTQPFKTILVSMMDGLSPHAKAIGAVNTILPVRGHISDSAIPEELAIINQHNQRGPVKALYGFNTDWIGIRACIRQGLSPANVVRPQSSGLVCGAGGMARAAIYSLISLGVRNILICNRTVSKAIALAEHYNSLIAASDLPELNLDSVAQTRIKVIEDFASFWPIDVRQPTVIVCCIPRQAAGEPPTNFSLPEAWLKSPTGGVVVEVAYRQQTSPVAHQIKERAEKGWIFLDGLSVLPEQAFAQFELFTGRRAPRKLMREEIFRHSTSDDPIDRESG